MVSRVRLKKNRPSHPQGHWNQFNLCQSTDVKTYERLLVARHIWQLHTHLRTRTKVSTYITVLLKTTTSNPTLRHLPEILITGHRSDYGSTPRDNMKERKYPNETPPLPSLSREWSRWEPETPSGKTNDHGVGVKKGIYKTRHPGRVHLRHCPSIRWEKGLTRTSFSCWVRKGSGPPRCSWRTVTRRPLLRRGWTHGRCLESRHEGLTRGVETPVTL